MTTFLQNTISFSSFFALRGATSLSANCCVVPLLTLPTDSGHNSLFPCAFGYFFLHDCVCFSPCTPLFQGGACRRGCQDARDLLRYEAVVMEEALHQTLVEINETQSLLEEGRAKAAVRYRSAKEMIKAPTKVQPVRPALNRAEPMPHPLP